jgi:hypothetical protein
MATKIVKMLLNLTLSHQHFRRPVSKKMGAEWMDPWILDINPWIIKAESHQHALGFFEVPTLVLNRFWGEHSVRDVLPNHLLIDISDPQGIVIGVMFTN